MMEVVTSALGQEDVQMSTWGEQGTPLCYSRTQSALPLPRWEANRLLVFPCSLVPAPQWARIFTNCYLQLAEARALAARQKDEEKKKKGLHKLALYFMDVLQQVCSQEEKKALPPATCCLWRPSASAHLKMVQPLPAPHCLQIFACQTRSNIHPSAAEDKKKIKMSINQNP